MRAALALAERGLGNVAPNPSVGCVLVREGRVVGRGWTRPTGRPHGETEALNRAGEAARGATAYVTLEPCAHQGRTPPCAEALIAAGIARCVVGIEDPDPRVNGQGLATLRAAGIEVALGLCADEAAEVNAGYLLHRSEGRPLVTLKLAATLDGRIATKSGESRWITSEPARARVHLLRARHDAVLIGSNTAVADNPRLDVRLDGLEEEAPVRVVLDSRLRLPLTHDLVAGAKAQPTWLLTRDDADRERRKAYQDAGVEVVPLMPESDKNISLAAALKALGGRGITRLLVEGGGHLAAALLARGLVDRLIWFHAPKIIGGDGLPAVSGLGVERLAEAPAFALISVQKAGDDLVETYRRVT
ncbi:MAG: bifunctional diaminohydroxyphosphoribosylaminopyrimidine deaminase/5-amino-6-(5-phosphoribosylamino)uracil reductase RibD [Kiloniellales bacterium]